jgi:hypothetical protein
LEEVEAVRARYRPERIKTLFVGESAPHSGKFFYCGDTAMLRHMRSAVELALGESDDFLDRFQASGWFLDDLVLMPVNHLTKSQRRALCQAGVESLAHRIAAYRPEAIVSLLIGIKPFVDEAAKKAGSDVPLYVVPFPGVGHQTCFKAEIARIIPKLPRLY